MFQRTHFQLLRKRLEEPRAVMQVLVGPRQVGKTTLISQLLAASNIPNYFIAADAVPNTCLA
jgi:predicted AAA+ superfamily ATPase